MNLEQETNKLKSYIENNYSAVVINKRNHRNKLELLILAPNHDLFIRIADKDKETYIPNDYGIYLDYQANRKNASRLNYEGGGSLEKYDPNDFIIITNFLDKFLIRKKEIQTNIFDFINWHREDRKWAKVQERCL